MLPQPLTFYLAEMAVRERQLEIDHAVLAARARGGLPARSARPSVAGLLARFAWLTGGRIPAWRLGEQHVLNLSGRSGEIRAVAPESLTVAACCAPSATCSSAGCPS